MYLNFCEMFTEIQHDKGDRINDVIIVLVGDRRMQAVPDFDFNLYNQLKIKAEVVLKIS